MNNDNTIDIATVRARLAESQGKTYWQSLDDLADTDEFAQFMESEFPRQAPSFLESLSRRGFLKLMGASLAMAGLTACYPIQRKKLVPYIRQPEEMIPGKPLYFATAMVLGGYATGLLVESHEGRPTKIEGNPGHPASLGAAGIYQQASVLDMYDPDRARKVSAEGKESSWENFLTQLENVLKAQKTANGSGLRLLTETVTSPTLVSQIQQLLKAYPQAKWYQYDAANTDNVRLGARMAFGTDADVLYDFTKADIVLALDGDFMDTANPAGIRYAHDFATRRRVHTDTMAMSRFYAAESYPSLTGGMADHRLSMKPSRIEHLARAVAGRLGIDAGSHAPLTDKETKFVDALVGDLQAARGRSLVTAGYSQPPAVHALAHALNQALGNVGQTVRYVAPVAPVAPQGVAGLRELSADMAKGQVDAVVIVGGNPVYSAPVDLQFADLLGKIRFSAYLGAYDDETAAAVKWHIPESHYLEAWGDARAFDGTVSLTQPLIEPLYESKSAHELVAALLGDGEANGQEIVMAHWQGQRAANFDQWWKEALQEGLIAGTTMPAKAVTAGRNFGTAAAPTEGLEIIFRPDPTIYDGRFNNNGWLQELPKPMSSMVWDNAALLSPRTAEALGVKTNDMIELTVGTATANFPVWVTPGHCDEAITVTLGYGRERTGRVGTGTGFNAYPLRLAASQWFASDLQVKKLGNTYPLVSTQNHFALDGNREDLFQKVTLAELAAGAYKVDRSQEDHHHDNNLHPPAISHGAGTGAHLGGLSARTQAEAGYDRHNPHERTLPGVERYHDPDTKAGQHQEELTSLSFYPQWEYSGNAWGMVIDLSVCNGCSACVVACNSENNIPVVGKEEVAIGRELHWLRVDRYYEGDLDEPELNYQPRMCVHCEKAPCETVCPVEATTHDAEGLNVMTYNRCVGTRYCANNCPYKVRRFNYYQHTEEWFGAQGWGNQYEASPLQLMLNPDVTVRSRGVMEKCSYCVQRINAARIESKKDNRPIADGEVVTACQAACPTQAIIFGNLNDPNSQVAKAKKIQQNFHMLPELNTAARTTYLAKVVNPNPALKGETDNAIG